MARHRDPARAPRAASTESADPPGEPRWSRLASAATVLVLAAAALLALRQVGSLDVGFHLRAGEQILEGQGWPRNDSFTYTVNDRPYIDTSWGYQVALAALHRLGGSSAMVLGHVALVVLIFGLVWLTARLAPADPVVIAALLAMGVAPSELRFETRPEIASYALLALVIYLLMRRAVGRPTPLWSLPLIFLVWANVHSLVVLGWIVLALAVVAAALAERRLDRPLAIAAVVSVAVALVNPYGWQVLTFPWTLATRMSEANVFSQSIGEFVSPFAWSHNDAFPFRPRLALHAFQLFFVLVVLTLPRLVVQRRWLAALLAPPFLYLSFSMIRNMPLLVVAATPAVAWALGPGFLTRGRWGRRVRGVLLWAVVVATVVVGARVWTDAHYIASRRSDRFGLGWNRVALPIDAAHWLATTPYPGRMLNHLNYGGYLMWAQPAPVFIDGRLEVIGERFFEEYRRVLATDEALEAAVARWSIDRVVFPYRTNPELLGRLSRNPRWRLVYVDGQAVVFAREARGLDLPIDESALRAQATRSAPLLLPSVPGLDGTMRPGAFARIWSSVSERQSFPDEAFGWGLFHHFRGEFAPAATRFATAVQVSEGRYYELYHNLGAALARLGRRAEAAACYRIVLAEAPGNTQARRRLADLQ